VIPHTLDPTTAYTELFAFNEYGIHKSDFYFPTSDKDGGGSLGNDFFPYGIKNGSPRGTTDTENQKQQIILRVFLLVKKITDLEKPNNNITTT